MPASWNVSAFSRSDTGATAPAGAQPLTLPLMAQAAGTLLTQTHHRIVAHVVDNSLPVHNPAGVPRQRLAATHSVPERELLHALAKIGRVAAAGSSSS